MTDIELMKIVSELVENGFKVHEFSDDGIVFVKRVDGGFRNGIINYAGGKFLVSKYAFSDGNEGFELERIESLEFEDYCDMMEFIRRYNG